MDPYVVNMMLSASVVTQISLLHPNMVAHI